MTKLISKKNKTYLIPLFVALLVFSPVSAHAQSVCQGSPINPISPTQPSNLTEVVCLVINGLNSLVPVVISLALLVFLWGLAKFILASGDEKNIQAGKDIMIWGVIGLFIMVSVWGIVNILYGSFFSGGIRLPFLNDGAGTGIMP